MMAESLRAQKVEVLQHRRGFNCRAMSFHFLFYFILTAWSCTTKIIQASFVERALTQYRERGFDEARTYLTKLLQSAPLDDGIPFALGVLYQQEGNRIEAEKSYKTSLEMNPRSPGALFNLGLLYQADNKLELSVKYVNMSLQLDPNALKMHKLGQLLNQMGSFDEARKLLQRAVSLSSQDANMYFDLGVSMSKLGKVMEAAEAYNTAIMLDQGMAHAWLNIASLHHRFGTIDDAIRNYRKVLEMSWADMSLRRMAELNLGIALESTGEVEDAIASHVRVMQNYSTEDPSQYLLMLTHLIRAKRRVSSWQQFDDITTRAMAFALRYEIGLMNSSQSTLLPFDALLLPISTAAARQIAERHSSSFSHLKGQTGYKHNIQIPPSKKLRIAYISFDFGDHPTSHLMLGLFADHNRSEFEVIAYGYGKDDNSSYRSDIMQRSDRFVELTLLGHQEAVETIFMDEINILLDAQAHTLGGRAEIVASRPAPIIVNYLVFAGTMGADYVDYFVADRFTIPAENSNAFTEKLFIHPHCYQVNHYSAETEEQLKALFAAGMAAEYKESIMREYQLPSGAFVFANFNKLDKLDPQTFQVWMSILRQVPRSVLWLLDVSQPSAQLAAHQHLSIEAAANGIDPKRLIFAPRVDKAKHLVRMNVADLFLDSFIYGAHSTATDALKAGLPVLTLQNEHFASRVASSLLENVGLPELITYTMKEFEDTAVWLAENRPVVQALKAKLMSSGNLTDLFNTREHVFWLERGMQSIWELYSSYGKTMHILTHPQSARS